MDWPITLIAAALGVAVTTLCGWLGARPPDPNRGPRLFPYRMVMVLGAAFVMLMLVHMINLAGVTTGR